MNYPYYDKDGTGLELDLEVPEDREKFRELWDNEYRKIGSDTIGIHLVSTVFIPVNHNWGDGPPIIFETMVFGNGLDSEYQWRYFTEEAARAGHAKIVEAVRSGTLTQDTQPFVS